MNEQTQTVHPRMSNEDRRQIVSGFVSTSMAALDPLLKAINGMLEGVPEGVRRKAGVALAKLVHLSTSDMESEYLASLDDDCLREYVTWRDSRCARLLAEASERATETIMARRAEFNAEISKIAECEL